MVFIIMPRMQLIKEKFIRTFTFIVHSTSDHMGKLRLEVFKPHRKSAQEKYRTYLDGYVKFILGRPMESLAV